MNTQTTSLTKIEVYQDTHKDGVIAGIIDLQEVERKLTETRLPGNKIAEPYFRQLQREIQEKSGVIFVAQAANKVVGFIACWIEHDNNVAETTDSTTFGYISDAWVAAQFRNQGIFKQLNSQAEKYLAGFHEVKLIRIGVLANNIPALMAYQKTGYKPEEITLMKRL